ncbi:MAG: DUF58 domain-containing protein [Bradymonadia bacterium]
MNLRELNYILIPRSPEVLERWAEGPSARLIGPLIWLARHGTREGQVVFVITLVCAAAGVNIRFSHLYLIFCALMGLWVAAFCLRPLARIPDVQFSMSHAPRVEADAVIELTAVVHNAGTKPVYALRINGPFLNWDGVWVGNRPEIPHLGPGETVRVSAQAKFSLRGPRIIGRFRLGSVRPLLLLSGPQKASEPVRFTVVPPCPQVQLPPPWGGEQDGGSWRSKGLVGGAELRGVRPYQPGDRLRDLHSRSWGRVGVPMVREYLVSSRPRVHIWVDPGTGGERGRRELMNGIAAMAHGVVVAMLQTGAEIMFTVVGQSEHVVGPIAPGGAIEPILDQLAVVGPEVPPNTAPPMVSGALAVVIVRPKRSSDWTRAMQPTRGLIDIEISDERRLHTIERDAPGQYRVPLDALNDPVVLW